MKITLDEVEHVTQLARLRLPEEQMKGLMKDMNEILDYMDLLNEIDTSNLEPTSHVINIKNVFREDTILPSLPYEKSLKNAPEEKQDSFVVPRVI